MTGKELFAQMLALGGKTQWIYPQENSAKYAAATRAIAEVNKLFPVEKTVRLLHYPIRPEVYHGGLTVHKGGEDIEFNASDIKSLAFAVSGTGRALLSSPDTNKTHTFEWSDALDLQVFRGIVSQLLGSAVSQVKLVFTGDFTYMIQDVSLYNALVGEMSEDVDVYSSWTRYDMSDVKYAGARFLSFASLPVRYHNVNLNAPTDYRIEGSSLYLRTDKSGTYEVRYQVTPFVLTADNEDVDIELDGELCELVALRAAYYLYMITDVEVADRCLAEYQRLMGIVMSTAHKVRTPNQFRDVRGW